MDEKELLEQLIMSLVQLQNFLSIRVGITVKQSKLLVL
jgi:hypothetical protein